MTNKKLFLFYACVIIVIFVGFFFDLGKYEGAGYLVAIYLLLTAPEVIKKIRYAMNMRNQ